MINKLIDLGRIPKDKEISNELFENYDTLIQSIQTATYKELEIIIQFFSDDCNDLNWGLVHLIESLEGGCCSNEQYKALISNCNNTEFKKILTARLENSISQ